jgi:translocation and assembly module TamB
VRYGFDGPLYRRGQGWGELELSPVVEEEGPGVPVSGRIPLVVEDGVVTTEAISLETAGSEAAANGKYELSSLQGKLFYQVSSTDLGELSRIWPQTLEPPPEEMDIETEMEIEDGRQKPRDLWLPSRGVGDFWGVLTWSPGDLRSDVYLDLQGARAPGLSAAEVTGTVTSSRGGVDRLALEAAGPGSALLLNGRIGKGPDASWELDLNAAGWPLEQMKPWIPFVWPVEGPFTGTVVLSGAAGTVYGRAQGSSPLLRWQGQDLGAAAAELSWGPEILDLYRAQLWLGGGQVQGQGWLFFEDDALDLSLNAREVKWEELPFGALGQARLEGTLSGEARLAGSFECPELRFRLRGASLEVAGAPMPEDAEMGGTWNGDTLSVGGGWPGVLYLSGGGRLDREGADLDLEMALQDLAVLARAGGATEVPVSGFGSGRVKLSGSWADPSRPLEMTIRAAEADGWYGDHPLELVEPAVIRASREGVVVESLFVAEKGRNGEAFVTGSIDGLEVDLRVQARVPNAWLTDILPPVTAEGVTDMLLTVTGSPSRPLFMGVGDVRGGRLVFAEFPHSADELEGILIFDGRTVILDTLTGEMGGGSLRGQGKLELPGPEQAFDLTLSVAGRDLNLRYPEGWVIAGDGDLNLTWNDEARQVRGAVELRRADFVQDVEMGVAGFVEGFFRHQRVEVAAADGALAGTELALSVEIPERLRIRNNLADLEGHGSLTIRGTMARPLIFGSLEADPGGTLVYAETTYRTERALLTFANPYRIEPLVDLVASTEIRDYEIRLTLTGTPDRLQASFFSNPPLPEIEVLRLVATGGSSAGSFTGAPGAGGATAERLLFGQAASIISQRVNNLFGLDTFRIEPLVEGGDNVSSARVEVGKRLTNRLSLTYSYAPTDSDDQGLIVEWQLFEGVFVVATQNRDGTYTLDIRREQRF